MQLNKLKFFILTFLGISIGLILSFYSQTHAVPYFFDLSFKSKQIAACQVFYDIGKGYNESHSVSKNFDGNQTGKLTFDLPAKKTYGLRFDPLDRNGSLEIKSIAILGKEKDGDQHQVLHEFDLKSLKAVQQVDLVLDESGNLIATTHNDCNDPVIELPLNEPLDHWKISDFLGIEWLKKSAFFALLITPIALALSFSENKKRSYSVKISFKTKGRKQTLEWGETFRSTPEKCYQDTTESNIRTLIDQIKKGTHWKQAVKEKFKSNNPWLYDIVTSPKRTKFVDDFIKPKDLQILDIGAGWGQFTLPLAKQNQICSLEPTPERLDFISAAADQEKVSKNISFIGANYFDIKFENKFDLILSIGVLEWVGAFRIGKKPEDLQLEFLNKIKSELNEDGKLIIGIENRLGLKYLMGAPDDHIGHPNITIHQKELAKKLYKEKTSHELRSLTHSMPEYKDMLLSAGFNNIIFYTSNPDYKLPVKIFPIKDNNCELNEYILNKKWINEHDGTNGRTIDNQDELESISKSIAELSTFHNFSPSFFIEAS